MSYRAPVADIAFALKHAAGLKAALAEGLYGDLDEETVDSVLEEAGRFAGDVIAPLNRIGDTFGTPFKDGNVTTPPGWKEAYTSWAAAGWNGLASPAAWGGQELPHALNAACVEMWNSASMAFGIGPVLTMAAMFTMMNRARLAVALQGVAIAERATQQAMDYARDRKQSGHASSMLSLLSSVPEQFYSLQNHRKAVLKRETIIPLE